MKSFVAIVIVSAFGAGVAFAAPNPAVQSAAQSVNNSCQAEAQTAGCPGAVAGKGLLKCIWHYKRANRKSFTISSGCHSAMKSFRMARHGNH